MKIKCPCCQSKIVKKVIYSKKNCPVVNNVVYRTEREALNCAVGNVELVLCSECNFVFNYDVNKELISYNEEYNNVRIFSPAYRSYLDELVNIYSVGINKKTKILEIGCGKGEFLKRLCSATGAQGSGYDTIYQGEDKYGDNVSFFRRYFDPVAAKEKYDVVILRHVLEHIPDPYNFLKRICTRKVLSSGAQLWIEVPDFEWILNKGVFYDITYEHCNYFFKQTLANLLSSIGFRVINIKDVFEGQYILLEATYTSDKVVKEESFDSPSSISTFVNGFFKNKEIYNNLIKKAKEVCIWGASGKGVIFLSELTDEILENIKYVIDINPQKQGGFLPVSAKKVESPKILKGVNGPLVVLIMNEIYEQEIKKELEEMEVKAQTYVI